MDRRKPTWITYIQNRIRRNKNFICPIIGKTGSGKSWSALAIAEMLEEDFNVDSCIFRSFELMELMETIPPEKKGKVIIWDEAGIDLSSRSWQSKINQMMNFYLQTFRHRNIILLFTVPYTSFLDTQTRKLLHATFETVKIHNDKAQVELKPKYLQYNPALDKTYEHYLVRELKGRWSQCRRWMIPKPSKALIEAYEEKKLNFTSELYNKIKHDLKKQYNKDAINYDLLFKGNNDRQILECLQKRMSITETADYLGLYHSRVSERATAINKILHKNGYETVKIHRKVGKIAQIGDYHPKNT